MICFHKTWKRTLFVRQLHYIALFPSPFESSLSFSDADKRNCGNSMIFILCLKVHWRRKYAMYYAFTNWYMYTIKMFSHALSWLHTYAYCASIHKLHKLHKDAVWQIIIMCYVLITVNDCWYFLNEILHFFFHFSFFNFFFLYYDNILLLCVM